MSTTSVLRPTSQDAGASGWTFAGGPTTLWEVLADESDTTKATSNTNNAGGSVGWGVFTLPTGAQIRSVALKLRASGTGGYFSAGVTFYGSPKVGYFTTGAKPPGSATDYQFKPMSLNPVGAAWNSPVVNRIKLVLGANSGVAFYRAELQVVYNQQPTVSSVGPSGTIQTQQPTISWVYADPDGDAEERWLVRVFPSPLPAGTSADTAVPAADSGKAYVGAPQANTWLLPAPLPPGVYEPYVKAADAGSGGRYSQWASGKFTVVGAPPAPPKLVAVTPEPTLGRVTLIVEQTDNLLTLADYGGEEQTGGYLRWKAISGISAGPTVVAGVGLGGSAGIQATANGSAAISARTPIGLSGMRVVAGRQYIASNSIKASAGGGTANLNIEFYDSAGSLVQAGTVGSSVGLTTSFQKSTAGPVNAPAGAVYALLRWTTVAALTNGVVLTWDQGQLREDSVATVDYRGGLDSRNLLDPQDSTWASTSLTGTSWAVVGTGSLAAVANAAAYDGFELQVAPGTVGGSHALTLGNPVRLPVAGGLPNANYQVQFQARIAAGSGLTAAVWFYFLDDNNAVAGAPIYGGTATPTGSFTFQSTTADAPAGGTQLQVVLVLSGETNTTDRWAFDQFGVIRVPDLWFFAQPWKPPSQVDTYPLAEYSDDSGATWTPIRGTQYSLYDPISRQSTAIFDYEAPPNTARLYRARTAAIDFQADPVNGALTTSAPSSAIAATLAVTDFWLIDPYIPSRIKLPHIGDFPFSSDEPQGVFAPLGRRYPVVQSDVTKAETFRLILAFNSAAEYDAFATMRDSRHTLLILSPAARFWYVKLGGARETTWLTGTPTRADGGAFTVSIPAYQVARPAP